MDAILLVGDQSAFLDVLAQTLHRKVNLRSSWGPLWAVMRTSKNSLRQHSLMPWNELWFSKLEIKSGSPTHSPLANASNTTKERIQGPIGFFWWYVTSTASGHSIRQSLTVDSVDKPNRSIQIQTLFPVRAWLQRRGREKGRCRLDGCWRWPAGYGSEGWIPYILLEVCPYVISNFLARSYQYSSMGYYREDRNQRRNESCSGLFLVLLYNRMYTDNSYLFLAESVLYELFIHTCLLRVYSPLDHCLS